MEDLGAKTAQEYYDSEDANLFYLKLWGGENIHVGIYDGTSCDSISIQGVREASIRSTDCLLDHIPHLSQITHAADLGSGIGGGARSLCGRSETITVDCFDVSTKHNETNRELSQKTGFWNRINIVPNSYLSTGAKDCYYDLITSQDSFLHCSDRKQLASELARILAPKGYIVFTDLMQTLDADPARLKPIYDRLHLDDMCCKAKYEELLRPYGIHLIEWKDLTQELETHYSAVRNLLIKKGKEFGVGDSYIERASVGLDHWIQGSKEGQLQWGVLVFQKA